MRVKIRFLFFLTSVLIVLLKGFWAPKTRNARQVSSHKVKDAAQERYRFKLKEINLWQHIILICIKVKEGNLNVWGCVTQSYLLCMCDSGDARLKIKFLQIWQKSDHTHQTSSFHLFLCPPILSDILSFH